VHKWGLLRTLKKILLLLLLSLGFIGSSFAGAICMDGWRSYSSGSGTCSHHGGVRTWLDNKEPYYAPKRETTPKKKSYVPRCSKVPPKKRKKCLEEEQADLNWSIKNPIRSKYRYIIQEFGVNVYVPVDGNHVLLKDLLEEE
jgi:hypothetical protein